MGIGAEAQLSLAGYCDKFYRIEDRTNVQLTCTAPVHQLPGGAFVGNEQQWADVANGGSYTLAGN